MRISYDVQQFAQLRPIASHRIQILALHKDDLHRIGRPRWVMARCLTQAARLAPLHRPELEGHFLVASRKLANQKLRMVRMVGRYSEDSRVLEGRSSPHCPLRPKFA
jgi:hypothetical protein